MQTCGLRYDSVDSAYLDCLNDNLAVLLLHAGVADVRTPFACQWHFAIDPERPEDTLSVERAPAEALIREQTGCALEWRQFEDDQFVAAIAPLVRDRRPALVIGDAYFTPWLPYFGREHMEHSFIIDGLSDDGRLLHVVDAYANKTEWGEATPTESYLPSMALERIIRALDTARAGSYLTIEQSGPPPPLDLDGLLRENAAQILASLRDRDLLGHFSRHYAGRTGDAAAIKRFVLDCWLVARSRALHGLWLADVARDRPDLLDTALADAFAQEVVAPWQRVNEFAYILFRRVSLGRAAPDACFRMLEQTIQPNEIRVAEQFAARLGAA